MAEALPAKYTTTVFVPFGKWVTIDHGLDVYGPVVQVYSGDGERIDTTMVGSIRHRDGSFDFTLSGWVFLEKEDGSGELVWEDRGGDWMYVVVTG